jgi:hypothetical protein
MGGAAAAGSLADTWRLQLDGTAAGEGGFRGAWRPGQPLDAARSWHTASAVSAAEVRTLLPGTMHSLVWQLLQRPCGF